MKDAIAFLSKKEPIFKTIIDTIGATPLVRLPRCCKDHGVKADIVAKLEYFNPLSSVKDRIGLAMVAGLGLGRAVPELTDWRPHQGRHGLGSVCTSG